MRILEMGSFGKSRISITTRLARGLRLLRRFGKASAGDRKSVAPNTTSLD